GEIVWSSLSATTTLVGAPSEDPNELGGAMSASFDGPSGRRISMRTGPLPFQVRVAGLLQQNSRGMSCQSGPFPARSVTLNATIRGGSRSITFVQIGLFPS